MLWQVGQTNEGTYVREKPNHILHGHDDDVTCVAVNSDLDIVVSGSKDGSCIIHTARKGRYVRSIYPAGHDPNEGTCQLISMRWIGISSEGYIVTYSLTDLMLHLFTINGRHLTSVDTNERLYAMMFSSDGQHLVTGGDRKIVMIRTVHDLKVIHRFKAVGSVIRSIATTPNEQHLLVGLQTGHILIYALNATYLRKRFLKRLANLGF